MKEGGSKEENKVKRKKKDNIKSGFGYGIGRVHGSERVRASVGGENDQNT